MAGIPSFSADVPMTATAPVSAHPGFSVREMTDDDWPLVQAGFAHSYMDCHAPATWDWRFQRHLPAAQGWRGWLAQATEPGQGPDTVAWVAAGVHAGWLRHRPHTILLPRDNYSHPQWRSGGKRSPYVQVETAFHAHQTGFAALSLGFGLDRRIRLAFLSGIAQPFEGGQWMQAPVSARTPHQGCSVQLGLTCFDTPEWDALWLQRREKVGWSLVRDQAFLSWRFDPRQGRTYHRLAVRSATSPVPLGYLVWQLRSPTEAVLVDSILPTAPQQLRDTWGLVSTWLHRQGVRQALTFVARGCPEWPGLHALGWAPCPAPLPTLPGFRLYGNEHSARDVNDHYAFTLADSDLF